ncbi:MAG: hypothetical protein LBV23_01725 [Deltaproteobacteria bacterium]|nr:hypothetical protein [Deltaproteobacteria bacterium]
MSENDNYLAQLTEKLQSLRGQCDLLALEAPSSQAPFTLMERLRGLKSQLDALDQDFNARLKSLGFDSMAATVFPTPSSVAEKDSSQEAEEEANSTFEPLLQFKNQIDSLARVIESKIGKSLPTVTSMSSNEDSQELRAEELKRKLTLLNENLESQLKSFGLKESDLRELVSSGGPPISTSLASLDWSSPEDRVAVLKGKLRALKDELDHQLVSVRPRGAAEESEEG